VQIIFALLSGSESTALADCKT